jgi:hypothetical protein
MWEFDVTKNKLPQDIQTKSEENARQVQPKDTEAEMGWRYRDSTEDKYGEYIHIKHNGISG